MMQRMKLWMITAIVCGATELLFTSCQSGGRKSSSPEATGMIIAASETKDNERVLSLADSLEKAGKMSATPPATILTCWFSPAAARSILTRKTRRLST